MTTRAISVETDASLGTTETVVAQTLGGHIGVNRSGRLGSEVTLAHDEDREVVRSLRDALAATGARVMVSEVRRLATGQTRSRAIRL